MTGCSIVRTSPPASTPENQQTLNASYGDNSTCMTKVPVRFKLEDECDQNFWIAVGFFGSPVDARNLDLEREHSKPENRRVVRFARHDQTREELEVANIPVKCSEGTQYLCVWQLSQGPLGEPDFNTTDGPLFLGSNYVAFQGATGIRFFGKVTQPQIPDTPDPANRVAMKRFAPLPTAGCIVNLEYLTGIGIQTIFLTILRGNDRVPDSPFNGAVRYLTQGIFKVQVNNVITWRADSVADGKQEPTNALDPDNKLVVWEQSRGTTGPVYSPHVFSFFGKIEN